MTERPKFTTVDEYVAAASPEVQPILKKLRKTVQAAVPKAQETISYQIPAFRLNRVFFYFAAFKNHIGIYPPLKGGKIIAKALQPYRGEKGNLKFPLEQPIPYALVGRVAKALARQYSNPVKKD